MKQLLASLLFFLPCGAFAQQYDGVVRTSFYVESFDGTRLAVDVYRPASGGTATADKLPTVYVQSRSVAFPNGKRNDFQGIAIEDLVRHGYVWVGQDRRGVGASFGSQRGFITTDDAQDGKAVIAWITQQPWSDGKVAMVGGSNHGEIQYAVAVTQPPGLKAISPAVASPDFFQVFVTNGVPQLPLGMMGSVTTKLCAHEDKAGTPVDGPDGAKLAEEAAKEHACNLNLIDQYLLGMARDDWNARTQTKPGIDNSPAFRFPAMKNAHPELYQFAGWYDPSVNGELAAFHLWGGKMVIGPWGHGGTIMGKPQGFPDLPDSTVDVTSARIAWLDSTLKGKHTAFRDAPAIRYYTMHAQPGKEWSDSAVWPPAGVKDTRYFLASGDGGAAEGELRRTPAERGPAMQFRSDYSADLFDGKYHNLDRDWPGDMRKGIDSKGATFTTAALEKDVQITGTPVAHLWATTNPTDGDFFVFVEDVDPQGVSHYVSHSSLRASNRAVQAPPWGDFGLPYHTDARADWKPVTPGEPFALDFALGPTSYVVRKGHRIRITVTAAAGDAYQSLVFFPSPVVTISQTAPHASYVVLPLM